MSFRLDQFRADPESGVLINPQYKGFGYSDGDSIEMRILQALKATRDVSTSSEELVARIVDWPTEYHFTNLRHNLLRHLRLTPHDRVLELGAGCGAITRQLGESGAQVTAVEGSLQRARCARERCRDLPNVDVYCSDFQEIAVEDKYDIVTLIGVLEYSPVFFRSADPFQDCLQLTRNNLKPGGCLVIAIENRLGLKYFCGHTEDHAGTAYFGIEDRYVANGVRTLGMAEMKSELVKAGFSAVEFQYPFPDYKLPRFVFRESAFQCDAFQPCEIISNLQARDYSGAGKELIEMRRVWPVLARNGLATHLSNSFLIFAADGTLDERLVGDPALLALGYTVNRAKALNTSLRFCRTGDGGVAVLKAPLSPGEPSDTTHLRQRIIEESYIRGRSLHSVISDHASSAHLGQVLECLGMWVRYLRDNAALGSTSDDPWRIRMKPDFVDCLPPNLIVTSEGLRFIDREWYYAPPYDLGSLVLRYVTELIFQPAFGRLVRQTPQWQGNLSTALSGILHQLNLNPPADAFQSYKTLHDNIARVVYPGLAEFQNRVVARALGIALPPHEAEQPRSLARRVLSRIARTIESRAASWK